MKKIAVTTDYSKNAQNAVEYACNLATYLDAELTIIHTYDIWVPVSEVPVVLPPANEIEEENKTKLTQLVNQLREKYPIQVNYYLSAGSLIGTLEDFVKKNNIEILIMGMRGGNEIGKHLLGSNTIAVIDAKICPVLVIPENYSYKMPTKFAFSADLQKTEEEKFHILKYFVKRFNGELQIFNIVSHQTIPEIKQAIEGIKLDAIFEDVKHDYYFPEASEIAQGIDRFVHLKNPDWLIIIPREHSFFYRLFKETNTEKIIYNSKIPVLALV